MNVELSAYDPAVTYLGQGQFDCEHDDINRFVCKSLKPQVKRSLSKAYVLTDPTQQHRFAGFYTIAFHSLDMSELASLDLGSLPRKVPCLRLIMLGVDKQYKGQKLGKQLTRHALALTKRLGEEAGSFGLYLDADPKVIGFYQKLGFVLLDGDKTPLPSPMFIQRSAI